MNLYDNHLTVQFEQHAEDVVADQRDTAAWEVQPFRDNGAPALLARFIGWHAMKRQGRYTGTFEQFNTVDCVEVRNTGERVPVDPEAVPRLDPGERTTSDGRSSTSQRYPDSRSPDPADWSRGIPETSTP